MNACIRIPIILSFVVAFLVAGCATRPPGAPALAASPAPLGVLRSVAIDRALEERILALDPERISADDVRNTLAKAPAPRILLVHGGIYPVYLAMVSTGQFLGGMGYPENSIRDPVDRAWSHSPYEDSAQIAGLLAWHYERDGMRPMLIGHSQGGVQVVRILYEFAGRFGDAIHVWNPYLGDAEQRTTIVDPLTGRDRPVIGLSASYASEIGAGGSMLLLPNLWAMMDKVYTIPDTVDEFTAYTMDFDFIAWKATWTSETNGRRPEGRPNVRNVLLPTGYNHLTTPFVEGLLDIPAARAWIEAYVPDGTDAPPPPEAVGYAIVWAADVWHSVKKHWVLEVQRLIRARRAALGPS